MKESQVLTGNPEVMPRMDSQRRWPEVDFEEVSRKPVSDELPDGGQSTASHCHIDIRIFEQNFDLAMIKNEG
jgi:hypothetical protein